MGGIRDVAIYDRSGGRNAGPLAVCLIVLA